MTEPLALQQPDQVPQLPLDWILGDPQPWIGTMAGAVYAQNRFRPDPGIVWIEVEVNHHWYTDRVGYRRRVVIRRVARILDAGFGVREIHFCPNAKGPHLHDLCGWCRDLAGRIAGINWLDDMEQRL